MSLNGLDNATIKEAYEAAVAEAGNWFLLKYASRDEVDLYSKGSGGVVELRNAIAKYEEVSPLYGFLRYRRRNVILKYQPPDCSRLVQARATVHFNAVCERFAPYDTTFEFAETKDLKDTKLSAACSLHAASGSTSSSTSSLRRRRLMEITEEEEEEERERKRQSIVHEERPGTSAESNAVANSDAARAPLSSPEPPVVLDSSSAKDTNFASTAEPPQFSGAPAESSHHIGAPRPVSPAKSDYISGRRLSSQSTRPDLYSYASYTYGKPKVKLGPRPSFDINRRPQTAGNFRPIASIPAGFKMFSKGSKKGKSDGKATSEASEDAKASAQSNPPMGVPIPDIPEDSRSLLPPRPATSSGASVKSMSALSAIILPPIKETGGKMTPEKARLMKAMKMREKKKMSMLTPETPLVVIEPPEVIVEADTVEENEHQDLDDAAQEHVTDVRRSLSNADSGIVIDLPTPMTVNTEAHTDDTCTDSHPASPTAASSVVGDSTKASSLSDSTDETVQQTTKDAEEAHLDDGSNAAEGAHEADLESDHYKRMASTDDNEPISEPHTGEHLDDETHEEPDVVAEERTPVAEEPQNVPDAPRNADETAESDIIRQSIETEDPSEDDLKIRTREVVLPPRNDAVSPRSPYGIPLSRFSSNDAKSPTTPSLKSKFSTQDLKSPTEPSPSLFSLVPQNLAPAPPEKELLQQVSEEPRADSSSLEPTLQPIAFSQPPKSTKKKAVIEPIKTDATPASQPDIPDHLLDDDAFMDELQAATVQEAQPMVVSKTPISPTFPSVNTLSPKKQPQSGATSPHMMSRTVSNPLRGPVVAHGDVSSSSARSVSAGGAALLHSITRQPSAAGLQAKKGNLGSSISQRIKALEQLSSKVGGEELRPRTAAPSSTFFTVRKQSTREPSKSPSVAERANSLSGRTGRLPTPERSREASPDTPEVPQRRERSGSVASRLSMFEASGASTPRGRPESIQVTARIVRDPNPFSANNLEVRKDVADYGKLELRQSPLFVNHQRGEAHTPTTPVPEPMKPLVETPHETIQERRLSKDRKSISEDGQEGKKRRSSLSIVKDFIKDRRTSISNKSMSMDNLMIMSPAQSSVKSPVRPPSAHQNSGATTIVRRLSISSRRSSISRDRENPTPVMSPAAFTDAGSEDDNKSEKRSKGRTSRFMRRLSNSLGGSRKNATPNISPTVAEEDDDIIAASIAESRLDAAQASIVAYIGDVNVQFPDSLLWKRRSMCLDTQGFLLLSAVQGAAANGKERTGTKRFHLSDFRLPYVPDVEIQELPNSVVLDFIDGSGLQIACEDRSGQLSVLHALQDAHRSHSDYGH